MVKSKFKKTTDVQGPKTPMIRWLSLVIVLSAVSIGFVYRKIINKFSDLSHELLVDPLLSTIHQDVSKTTTIGFFVSVTGCGSDRLVDGAAVLKHSIHLASIHGNLGGRYDYKMHAIYHPDAAACVSILEELGYKLELREVPLRVQDIQGEFLRSRIESNGCCGAKELIKLEAYTFTEYPVVVHLDIDFLLLKPLDDLFDAMLMENEAADPFSRIHRMYPDKPKPSRINAFFTRDCE
jgi:hypothetical protein